MSHDQANIEAKDILYLTLPVDETWSQISSRGEQPAGRHAHSAVLYDNQMWVYGGMTDLQERNDFWRFDTGMYWVALRCVCVSLYLLILKSGIIYLYHAVMNFILAFLISQWDEPGHKSGPDPTLGTCTRMWPPNSTRQWSYLGASAREKFLMSSGGSISVSAFRD